MEDAKLKGLEICHPQVTTRAEGGGLESLLKCPQNVLHKNISEPDFLVDEGFQV